MTLRGVLQRRRSVASAPSRGWIAAAYGDHADTLVRHLGALTEAATSEASLPTAAPSSGTDRSQHDRGLLWNELKELQAILVGTEIAPADADRDLRLRAAVATAVGAARNLALASSSQPTAGYLTLTRDAVDQVLIAAGRRALA